jgi:hypothetical protein
MHPLNTLWGNVFQIFSVQMQSVSILSKGMSKSGRR